jgi:predicted amidohydrolase YtcJ
MIDSNTHMVDVGGKTVLPGFIDAHTHMEMTAINRAFRVQIHAPPVQSIDDVLKRIKQKVQETPSDEWILARSCFHFDQKVVEKRYPTKAELDEVAPDHPVVLMSGAHISVLNSKALRMAGITKETPKRIKTTLGFGEVDKDPTGEPTGILRDALKALPLPKFTYNQTKGAIKQWMRSMFIMQGITSIHDMPNTAEGIRVYQELLANNELPLRIKIFFIVPHIADLNDLLRIGLLSGFGNERLNIGGVKLFVDGGITGPKAALYQPYPHDPYDYGLTMRSQEELTRLVVNAHKVGLQVIMHTTGERGQDMALNAIQAALHELPRMDHRHRLEHAGNYFATPERMERVKSLGAIPVPNPQFIHSFGFLMEHFYGERIKKGLFPYKMLLDMGFKLPFSSDSTGTQPEATNPFWGIWCAVARESYDGTVMAPEEKISVMDAIRCYTINSLIVVSEDPLSVEIDRIKDITVEMTIIDGKIEYEKRAS